VATNSYHDIASGSNGGETATAGWDYASGFGSTIVTNLNSNL
jgi:pseudomonalisin/xanthomonalisin